MRRLFMLVVLLAAVLAGWYMRDQWMREPAPLAADPEGVVWEPLTIEGAERTRVAVQQLARTSGPVFQNIRPGDLASYVYVELAKQLPPSAEDIRAAVIGERLYIKAWVRLSEMGAAEVLGPFAGIVGERDTVSFGGTFDIVRPGLAQFRVRDMRLRELSIPPRYVPRLLGRVRRGVVPEGVAEDGLPLEVPAHIGDVRIADGRITLYKNVP